METIRERLLEAIKNSMFKAARQGTVAELQRLAHHDDELQILGSDNATLLHAAVEGNNLPMVKYLMERVPDLRLIQLETTKRTPLHLACLLSRSRDMIKLLVENCTSDYVNMEDSVGETAIMYVIRTAPPRCESSSCS